METPSTNNEPDSHQEGWFSQRGWPLFRERSPGGEAPVLDRKRKPKSKRAQGSSGHAAGFGFAPLEVRTDGGRTIEVPAGVAAILIASLFLVGLLAAVDPITVGAAAIDRQADAVLAWEQAETRRLLRAVDDLEVPLRALRREMLMRGLVPEGDLAPTPCEGSPGGHLVAHAGEAARISAALAEAGAVSEESALPMRSPIDLTAGDYAITEKSWLSSSVHVSSPKGVRRDPFTGGQRSHNGLDISAPAGTPVIAPAAGTVLFAGSVDPNDDHYRSLLGNYVHLRHGESGYSTIYAHLSSVRVKRGAKVSAGETLGSVGSTGRSTAPHLHYQVMKGDEAVNPLRFITDVVLVRDGKSVFYARSSGHAERLDGDASSKKDESGWK